MADLNNLDHVGEADVDLLDLGGVADLDHLDQDQVGGADLSKCDRVILTVCVPLNLAHSDNQHILYVLNIINSLQTDKGRGEKKRTFPEMSSSSRTPTMPDDKVN